MLTIDGGASGNTLTITLTGQSMIRSDIRATSPDVVPRIKSLLGGDVVFTNFEGAIAELESIVKKLEEGDLPLEQSLALYERGVQLSRFCHARLEEAERRIEVLSERGELKPAPNALTADDSDRR